MWYPAIQMRNFLATVELKCIFWLYKGNTQFVSQALSYKFWPFIGFIQTIGGADIMRGTLIRQIAVLLICGSPLLFGLTPF